MAPIKVGDIIPDGRLTFYKQNRIETVSIHSIATGKKIILLGINGAFMPVCSEHHVARYIEKADELKSKGVQEILCLSVNDPFVMRGLELARFEDNGPIKFLSDTHASYVKSLGLAADLSSNGYGIRSERFALLIEDLRVKVAGVELRAEDMLVAIAETECNGHMAVEISPQLSDVELCNFHQSRTNNRNLAPAKAHKSTAPIQLGGIIPDGKVTFLNKESRFEHPSIYSLAAGKKVILAGVPGAFMPNCSNIHIPQLMEMADEFMSRGVQEILCLCVNDAFVLDTWELSYFYENKHIKFLSDSTGAYVKSLGLEVDLTPIGLDVRSRRFALYVDDLKIKAGTIEMGPILFNFQRILRAMDAESHGEMLQTKCIISESN